MNNKPLRVLQMIGSLNTGGSQAVVLNLYKTVDRNKIQFDFIIDKPDETALTPLVESLGGRVYTMPTFYGRNVFEIYKAWSLFFDQHPEYKILHSHVRSYASILLFIAKKKGLKTIIHSHNTSNGHGFPALAKKVLQYPLRYQADFLLSCSVNAGKWLFGSKMLSSPKYHLLQNAIDLDLYSYNETARAKVRQEIGIKDQTVYIHIGRLAPAKNHEFLLNVFANIEKNNKDSILLLVGDGELQNQIASQIKELGLDGKALMLGLRKDVPELLSAADCLLFPSKWEGLPVTTIEAQASGLPCLISSNVDEGVFVSSLAKKVSIDHGVGEWIRCINKTDMHRHDVKADLRKAGFDIHDTADWITNLYLSMHNDC